MEKIDLYLQLEIILVAQSGLHQEISLSMRRQKMEQSMLISEARVLSVISIVSQKGFLALMSFLKAELAKMSNSISLKDTLMWLLRRSLELLIPVLLAVLL